MKRGTFGWDIIGKMILLLVIILILLIVIGMLTGKSTLLWEKLKSVITFRS